MAYSGEQIKNDLLNFNIKYIVQVSKGEESYIHNIVPNVLVVNLSKGNKDMINWYKE
ncbi:hypothetical protein [Clostridium thermobutyricum]|uniref:hypothetical protein n=1 Tax=Clostridium thermobutyricum TaxID=29372 RepID=UPI0003AAC127|nr:hypothetical protein [Clostridium thermobutyricum]